MKFRQAKLGAAVAAVAIGQGVFCLYREITMPGAVLSQIAPNQPVRTFMLGGAIAVVAGFSLCVSLALGAAAIYMARGRGRLLVWVLSCAAVAVSLCLKPVGDARMAKAILERHLTEEN
jgi:hypothetical protein